MSAHLRAQVQYLLDRQVILDCINLAARGSDRLDAELLTRAFHDDAIVVDQAWVGYAPDFIRRDLDLATRSVATAHHITNHRCDIAGDVAHAETYGLVVRRGADEVMVDSCRYIDRFERRDGAWRIALRRVIVDIPGRATPYWFGSYVPLPRDRSDYSYQRPLELPAALAAQVKRPTATTRRTVDRFAPRIGSDDLVSQALHLHDRQAIYDCTMKYTHGMDRLDTEEAMTAFHPDAIVGGDEHSETASAFIARTLGRAATRLATAHHVASYSCEIDGNVAHAETYVLWFTRPSASETRMGVGRYVDRLERRGGAWRIVHRYHPNDTVTRVPTEGDGQGRRDRQDWSYRRPLALTDQEKARLGGAPPPVGASRGRAITDDEAQLRQHVRELADRAQIAACMSRYARGLDRIDRDAIESVFHADGVDAHGARAWSVGDFAQAMIDGQRNNVRSDHCMTCHNVELDGDTAHAETYLLWVSTPIEGEAVKSGSGRYFDRLERRDGEWRVAVRRFELDAAFSARIDARPTGGRRDRGDLSYARPLTLREPAD